MPDYELRAAYAGFSHPHVFVTGKGDGHALRHHMGEPGNPGKGWLDRYLRDGLPCDEQSFEILLE
jgi:hypothetical protein